VIIYTSIELHGFVNLDEDNNLCRETGKPMLGQEHEDHDSPNCDGWNVWVRADYPNYPRDGSPEPFTSIDALDRDFGTFEEAFAYGEALEAISELPLCLY
jgi:hypothetical protein